MKHSLARLFQPLLAAAVCVALPISATAQTTPPGGERLQVVAFGDSLMDAGTYSQFASAKFNGGRFTTNPGQIWTQQVAQYFGGELTPAFFGGFGQPLTPAGGLDYAQGGSRVTLQPGVGQAAAGTPNQPFALATTIPVTQQVDEYLTQYKKFGSDQLVLINGGANDLLVNLETVETSPANLPKALLAITQSAIDLGNLVGKISRNGGKHIVVLGLADFSKSPEVVVGEPTLAPIVQIAIQEFNLSLQATLLLNGVLDKVVVLDEFSFMDKITANPSQYGFTTAGTATACSAAAEVAEATQLGLSDPTEFSDSLFCSPATLTAPNADQTFVFADALHPTTRYSELFTQFAEQQMAAHGIGK